MQRKKTDPAEFNQEVTLQVRTNSALNDFGEENPSGSWDTLGTRWAKVSLKNAQQTWQTGNDLVDATHLVELWHDPTAAAMTAQSHRVVWGSRILRVLTVDDYGNEHLMLGIACMERLGAVS